MKMYLKLFLSCLLAAQVISAPRKTYSELKECNIGPLADEIASYDTVVKDIIEYVTTGPFKRRTYNELVKFIDKFGPRPSGSKVLEESIDYIIQLSKDEGIKHVTTEDVQVPHWIRGEEKLMMLEPRKKNMAILGLGLSEPTPEEGITAEVVVVSDFDELDALKENVTGKIVLFCPSFTSYGETVKYRSNGAARAAEKGAVVSLVRSIAPFSINSPHTGAQSLDENVKKIPAAAITLEDADLLKRMYERGDKIVLSVKMSSTLESNTTSRNTIVDLQGRANPEKLVIVSGHIDSWDVGEGAMDDGGGLFISWAVPVILKQLNLNARRTIRSIFWTAEELGYLGAAAYEAEHRIESDNINFIMEADEGTFAPLGLEVSGNQKARCIVAEVLKLFQSINASALIETDSPGSDITLLTKKGVPGAGLHNANEKYFWFHHTAGDTINVQDPNDLDLGAAFWTTVAYIIADITEDIPR